MVSPRKKLKGCEHYESSFDGERDETNLKASEHDETHLAWMKTLVLVFV
jgi:hypothetical protein